jgi:hypothetical protein
MSCPAQDGGLSKGIKYSYTLFDIGEAARDALTAYMIRVASPQPDPIPRHKFGSQSRLRIPNEREGPTAGYR